MRTRPATRRVSEDSALPGDQAQQVAGRQVRALLLVAEGKAEEGELLAAEAAQMMATSDNLNGRAEVRLTHASVLMALGRKAEARQALELALASYEEKENQLGIRRVRDLLAATG